MDFQLSKIDMHLKSSKLCQGELICQVMPSYYLLPHEPLPRLDVYKL